jgi:hypothetical protein
LVNNGTGRRSVPLSHPREKKEKKEKMNGFSTDYIYNL